MDRLVYTALSGMRRAEFAQTLTANNLANATTTGYLRDTGAFSSRWVEGGPFEARVQASEQLMTTELAPGVVATTGKPLDVAIGGRAMLAVQAPDGGEGYTRRGDLRVGATGVLETGDGRAVIGGAGPITLPPADRIEIAPDGTILIAPAGEPGTVMQIADRLKLVAFDADAMRKELDGLMRDTGGAAPADETARLTAGALESSNVSPVGAMVELIEQSRSFELSTKLVQMSRELDQSTAQLMRLE